MEDTRVVYSTRQAAEALGVGTAMMRRYAQTLEEVSGEETPQTRRNGRQFSEAQLRTLMQAKALVDSHNGLSVEAALRMVTQGEITAIPTGLPRGIADSGALVEALREAVTGPIVAELREPNAALLFAALSEAVTKPLVAELRELQADRNEMQSLRDEVASLRSQLAEARALPLPATPERIDGALEVKMRESQADPEFSPTAREVINTIDGVEPQRVEHESWITEAAVQALITASELPGKPREGGLIVKAAVWLERRLKRK